LIFLNENRVMDLGTAFGVDVRPGNRFAGFSDQIPWTFRTSLPHMVQVPNASTTSASPPHNKNCRIREDRGYGS